MAIKMTINLKKQMKKIKKLRKKKIKILISAKKNMRRMI